MARRDFASAELCATLQSQGFAADVIEHVLAQLVERCLVDDERYAQHFVSYHASRGQGPARIRQQLIERGLIAAQIDAALASWPDWHALAREVRIRKFGLAVPEAWAEKAQQARFLQYRGFSADHIRSALGADFDT